MYKSGRYTPRRKAQTRVSLSRRRVVVVVVSVIVASVIIIIIIDDDGLIRAPDPADEFDDEIAEHDGVEEVLAITPPEIVLLQERNLREKRQREKEGN